MSSLETSAAATGLLCVWLTVRENLWCWPIGIVSAALYAVVFAESRLYADMGLQVIFVLLQFFGWYEWLYGGAHHEPLYVTRTPRRLRIVMSIVFVAATIVLASLLHRYTDASLPWADAALAVLSLVAQYLMSFKYVECWLLWITVDVCSVWMYEYKALHLTAGLYFVFLCLACSGLLRWRRQCEA